MNCLVITGSLKASECVCREGLTKGINFGEGVQGDYAMQCLIKHDKADVGSPLLEAAPVQVFDYSGLCVGVPCGSGIF